MTDPTPAKFTLPRQLRVALIACGAIVLGTLLPWVNVIGFSANGTQTSDGKLVLVLGLVTAALIVAAKNHPKILYGAAVTGLGCLAASLYDTIHCYTVHENFLGERVGGSPGAGLWIDDVAAIVLLVALARSRQSRCVSVPVGLVP